MKPPLYGQWGSLFWWVGVFHIREVDWHCHSSWQRGYLPVSLPPFLLCLANHESISWVVSFNVGFTICQHQWALMSFPLPYIHVPSKVCSHITLSLGLHPSSVDALVDVHGRSHNFLLIHSREALVVGHWVITLLLFSCGINFVSPSTEVVLQGWGWYTCPMHDRCLYTRACWPLMQWEEVGFGVACMTSHVGLSLCKRDVSCNLMNYLPSILFPPILDLPLSLKSICLH